jgi:hypothetical protein
MPGDNAGHAVSMLSSVGVNAIPCQLGEFSKAVSQMEQGVAAGGTSPVPSDTGHDPVTTESEELAA